MRTMTEQEHLTQELQRREAYLAEAQKLSHTGSFGWKVASGEILWSEETFRIFEYDRTATPTVDLVLRRVHPEDAALVKQIIERASRDGKDFDFENRLLMPDSSVKHVRVVAHALSVESESVEFVGAVMDITDAKQVEDRIRRIIDAVPGLHWSARPDGWVDFINQRWLDYTGMTLGQALGWGWTPAYNPDEIEQVQVEWRTAVAEGKPLEMEVRLRRFDGEYRWFLERVSPLFDRTGRILGWYGSDIDIHDRKQAEEKLQQSEAYLAEAQRLSQTGSWSWGPDQDIRYWSEECYRVLSFDPHDGLPRFEEFFQRIHPDDQPGFTELIQTAIREKADWEADCRIVHPDGAVRDIHVVGHPVLSTSGHLVEFVGTVIDVTERRRAEQERARLRQLEADLAHINRVSTLGEMSASLTHEVTQPIGSVRNNARAALNFLDRQDLGEVKAMLECVVADADRAGDIVHRVRDHIKKTPPRKDLVELNEAVNEVILLARSAITENGVLVQTLLTEGPLLVQADRVQVQQVVLNLILNAVDAMGSVEGGPRELLIRTEQHQPNGVLVAVRDTGPGIDPEHLESVFEAFYTTKSNGVGMGLSICRSIIQAHGGRLWADANEARGAVFQFTLPNA
jgi:PAS domain S-box-containing protein